MLLTFSWLSIGMPCMYMIDQSVKVERVESLPGDVSDFFSSIVEEKGEAAISKLSEFFPGIDYPGFGLPVMGALSHVNPSGLYQAFHPELLVPPPNFS